MEGPRRGDLPLSAYGLVGDGRTAALVAADGAVDWLCCGRFDGPAVFCRLLDAERGGYFQVAPALPFAATRRYVGWTGALETRFDCAAGSVRLTDCMPPADCLPPGSGPTLLRRLEGLAGEVPVDLAFAPTFDFARAETRVEPTPDGCVARGGGSTLRLVAPARPGQAAFSVRAGETRWCVLSEGEIPPDPAATLARALAAWERWTAKGRYPGPYADQLRRSAIVLKMLIHAPTGAAVAAPTTSLPEDPGGVRNWDYRFSWLRDASWLVSALMDLGHHDESMAFLGWLERLDLAHRPLSVFYDLDGRRPAGERTLDPLRGWRGSRPVRVGNAAAGQDQHDTFGEVVAAIHLCWNAMPSMRPLSPGLWRIVSALADRAAAHWAHPDRGMWEVRDRPRRFVSSMLLCWTALDRALAIAACDGLGGAVDVWATERERIRATILDRGVDPRHGTFRRAVDDDALDATTLLLPRNGLLPADDPRVVRSVEAIRQRLGAGALLRRYATPDGLPGREGAFTACSFWLVDCLARQRRLDEACAVFERAVAYANGLGLFSEEIDPASGDLLGNFPQAFTHLALVRAAVAIAEAEGRED
jgi:GH15 family glucan-1,4-alpha-glucosidase